MVLPFRSFSMSVKTVPGSMRRVTPFCSSSTRPFEPVRTPSPAVQDVADGRVAFRARLVAHGGLPFGIGHPGGNRPGGQRGGQEQHGENERFHQNGPLKPLIRGEKARGAHQQQDVPIVAGFQLQQAGTLPHVLLEEGARFHGIAEGAVAARTARAPALQLRFLEAITGRQDALPEKVHVLGQNQDLLVQQEGHRAHGRKFFGLAGVHQPGDAFHPALVPRPLERGAGIQCQQGRQRRQGDKRSFHGSPFPNVSPAEGISRLTSAGARPRGCISRRSPATCRMSLPESLGRSEAAQLSSTCSGRLAPGMAQETASCIRIQRSANWGRLKPLGRILFSSSTAFRPFSKSTPAEGLAAVEGLPLAVEVAVVVAWRSGWSGSSCR